MKTKKVRSKRSGGEGTERGELCDQRILGGELDDLLLPLALDDLVDEGVLVVVAVLPVICMCIEVNASE